MSKSRAELLIQRYETLLVKQSNWRSVWQELADYIMPTRKNIVTVRSSGTKQTEKLFDSTAPDSAFKLAAFIAGSLTNMAIRWFSLKLRVEELNEDKEVSVWLDQCADEIYLSLRQSNFNTESQETYADLATFGTACILVDEKEAYGPKFPGYLFRSEAIGSYVISESCEGLVDTVFRKIQMTIGAAVQKWGLDKLSEPTQEKYKKNPDENIDIIHAVMPRETAPGRMKKNMPVASYYIERERKFLIDEGGYEEMPFMVVRWSKTSGEEYGRGPGHIALPDIKTLNKADELTLRGWGKIIEPPLLAREDGVLGRVRTAPSSINIVRDKDALTPLEQGGKWDVNAALTQDRRASIKRYFFADQLQLPDKTIITATEVDRRIELMQQVLGPTVGRLEYEYLNPLLARCFKMKFRARELPPTPQKLIDYAKQHGLEIDVEYEGPLARSQRGAEVKAFNGLLQGCMAVVQANPNSHIMDKLDDDAAFDFLLKSTGASKLLLRAKEDVATLRDQRQQMVNAQESANAANVNADSTQKLAAANSDIQAAQQGPTSEYGDLTQAQTQPTA